MYWSTQRIHQIFNTACEAHYECNYFSVSLSNIELMTCTNSEVQKTQHTYVDEFDAEHDLPVYQDRFEVSEFEAGPEKKRSSLQSNDSTPNDLNFALPKPWLPAAASMASSRTPPWKSTPCTHRRELGWKSQEHETVPLEDIARRFPDFILPSSTELAFTRRRGCYTTKTAHRCPGYNRIEITLTTDIARSAIVSHLTPNPFEICPVCKDIVKDADIFACSICSGGGKSADKHNLSPNILIYLADNKSIPTIRCSNCSEWHHRPCVRVFENMDESFVCLRCVDELNQPDVFPKPLE